MTSNCSRKLKWFQEYTEIAKAFHRASITASLHTEHVNTPQKMKTLRINLYIAKKMMYRLQLTW